MTTQNDNPGCLSSFLRILGIRSKTTHGKAGTGPNDEIPADLPYRFRDDFLSPAEHSFFLCLKGIIGDRLMICPKVSLADIFFVTHPDENMSAYNRINRKHVDFLLCDPPTMKPRFAIELDDRSHNRPNRVERDNFIDQVFETAGLSLVRIPAQAAYSADQINTAITKALTSSAPPVVSSPEIKESYPPDQPPNCPKCGDRMILRIARNGSQAGKKFYGCPNYPKCREIIPCKD